MRLPVEIHQCYMRPMDPEDLLMIAGVSHQLRRLAIPLLWRNIKKRDRWAKRMYSYMGQEIFDSADAAMVSAVPFCRNHSLS